MLYRPIGITILSIFIMAIGVRGFFRAEALSKLFIYSQNAVK